MTEVRAYAALAAGADLEPITIERREVGPTDVAFDIAFCGICHSDIHTVRGEWGPQPYPVVPGHELVGVVTAVGEHVTKFQVGDRVGVGCMVNSCGACVNCLDGEEQYCLAGNIGTYAATDVDGSTTQGGYSQAVVVDEAFVLRMPDTLPLDAAAPLLCAGATTFSPLKRFIRRPGQKVAVLGLGGLGHVAVKIAAAMGAEVTVLSHSSGKEADAKRLGAHDFQVMDDAAFSALNNRFDVILNTVSAEIDVPRYMRLLNREGAFVVVGVAPTRTNEVPANPAVGQHRSYQLSMIAGIAETQEMLDFCGEHGIVADIELIPATEINAAYERVVRSDVKFRFVIDAATI